MFRSKPVAPLPVKRVWRISKSAPMGEWVDKATPISTKFSLNPDPVASTELPEVSYGSWVTSSYDLLDGTDVVEDPDTIPGSLLDELFGRGPDAPKTPSK